MMPTVSPDQVNQQKQMLEGAAQLAHQRENINLKYEGRKKESRKGSRRQLITTIIVVVAIAAVLVLLSVLENR